MRDRLGKKKNGRGKKDNCFKERGKIRLLKRLTEKEMEREKYNFQSDCK